MSDAPERIQIHQQDYGGWTLADSEINDDCVEYIRADLANWQPIEKYDAMKKKPDAVFYFTEDHNGSYKLRETVQPSRYFGRRVCTHFMVLPDMPREKS